MTETIETETQQEQVALTVDGELLKLAATGGEDEQRRAFKRLCNAAPEELRLIRRALFRLESWLDELPMVRG